MANERTNSMTHFQGRPCFISEWICVLNESAEWKFQWLTLKDSPFLSWMIQCFWTDQFIVERFGVSPSSTILGCAWKPTLCEYLFWINNYFAAVKKVLYIPSMKTWIYYIHHVVLVMWTTDICCITVTQAIADERQTWSGSKAEELLLWHNQPLRVFLLVIMWERSSAVCILNTF